MMFAKFRNLKLRWKLLIGVLLYFVLVPVEGLVIGHIDRKTRADRSIFVAYVDRLPKPLWIPGPSYQGWCEHPRVWGFWRYKICTTMVTYTKSGASFGTEFPCPPPPISKCSTLSQIAFSFQTSRNGGERRFCCDGTKLHAEKTILLRDISHCQVI